MPKVKSGTLYLSISEKISVGRDRITALTGNTNVTVNPDKLTLYSAAVAGLSNAQGEVGNAQILLNEKYARRSDAEKEYNKQILMMVSEINSLTDDEAKLSTTGFPISETGTPETRLLSLPPGNVIANMGIKEGEIDIKWKAVRLSQGYIVEYSTDPQFPENTTRAELMGKLRKLTLKGMQKGSTAWVRVRGVKGNEKSPWSDPAMTLVP